MKRLLIPLSVPVVLFAALLLFQPSEALVDLPIESVQAQSSLQAYAIEAAPDPSWYDLDWSIRRSVTITNPGTLVTDTQVRVSLDSSFDFNHAQANGADLRVTAGDGTTEIPFWIESWNSTGQFAWVWVKVPSLPAGRTVIYLYYGNPAAVATSNGTAI